MSTIFQLRRGAYHDWVERNPRLREGEMGYEIDSGRYKVGDGVHHWLDLPFFTNESVIKAYVDAEIEAMAGGVTGVTVDDLNAHIDSDLPHPVYDDGASFVLLYENAKV